MRTLYLVPTPIGNLEDITLRALRILREVALIAAEDTRTSRVLLQHFGITTPLTSYHEHNKLTKLDVIFNALESGDVALISDAGTPGISDPGYELIHAAVMRGVIVTPLPGANAALTALIGSGLNTETFIFVGFPPKKQKARRELLERLAHVPRTLIFYESPNRLTDLLADIQVVLANRPIVVARELTKIYEEFQRGTAADLLAHYTAHPPRGEIVVLIDGSPPQSPVIWGDNAVIEALGERLNSGDSLRDAAKAIAAVSGRDRKAVYEMGLTIKSASK
ncbi:MAG: 16S rRNA (cytidine(1402)-2'-O)-methyltransferase [Anaerolineae bacterium]|nr:16S rRNA (cytidine(1402)-2'-O)-methyltransferase [Anaerolineae bacterium]